MRGISISPGFVKALLPATLGGGVWQMVGLPLGWLMGAAVVVGGFAIAGMDVIVPKPLYAISLTTLGASVGLVVTPDVAGSLLDWFPLMLVAAILGVVAAALMTPVLARFGKMGHSTAYFSLLPGGVVEMANIGEFHGANRTVVAALHALRVALVVGLLPIALLAIVEPPNVGVASIGALSPLSILVVIAIGLAGGWLATRIKLAAAWLLGALILVGFASSTGMFEGRLPAWLLIIVQIIVGISLGARFQRSQIVAVPRAMLTGLPVLIIIVMAMALIAWMTSHLVPLSPATMILSFSIGGMAEMVLTSKALGQSVAIVAAFQAVRAVFVNMCAGAIWQRLKRYSVFHDSPKG